MGLPLPRTQLSFGTGTFANRVGMRVAEGLDFDEWVKIGQRLGAFADSSAWWLGDWLFYGQWEYGSRYEEGVALTGLDYGTLRNYASVAGRFELSFRNDNLSFSHHALVASLPPGEAASWLARAEAEGWSKDMLRQELQGTRGLPVKTGHDVTRVTLAYPPDRVDRWKAAADQAGVELVDWIADGLDQLAAQVPVAA